MSVLDTNSFFKLERLLPQCLYVLSWILAMVRQVRYFLKEDLNELLEKYQFNVLFTIVFYPHEKLKNY